VVVDVVRITVDKIDLGHGYSWAKESLLCACLRSESGIGMTDLWSLCSRLMNPASIFSLSPLATGIRWNHLK